MNNWVIQAPQGAIYVLQEAPSSLVYALSGELVYALDGSLVQFGLLWANQLGENAIWMNQLGEGAVWIKQAGESEVWV